MRRGVDMCLHVWSKKINEIKYFSKNIIGIEESKICKNCGRLKYIKFKSIRRKKNVY